MPALLKTFLGQHLPCPNLHLWCALIDISAQCLDQNHQQHQVIWLPPAQRAQIGVQSTCCASSQGSAPRWVGTTSDCRAAPLQASAVTAATHTGAVTRAMKEARCWEASAVQQQLGVRRNQHILQWREAEPSSGPGPPRHKGIWNVAEEQSSLLISLFCAVKKCALSGSQAEFQTAWPFSLQLPKCIEVWQFGSLFSVQVTGTSFSPGDSHPPSRLCPRAESALLFAHAGQVQHPLVHPQDSWFLQSPHQPPFILLHWGLPSYLAPSKSQSARSPTF